jgi:hypothetical protein
MNSLIERRQPFCSTKERAGYNDRHTTSSFFPASDSITFGVSKEPDHGLRHTFLVHWHHIFSVFSFLLLNKKSLLRKINFLRDIRAGIIHLL